MDNEELLRKYAALAMQLQEEYLKKNQNFNKQKELQSKYSLLEKEILERMAE